MVRRPGQPDSICAPSPLESSQEGKGLLEKVSPGFKFCRAPSLKGPRRQNGGIITAFWKQLGSRCTPSWLGSGAASPAGLSTECQMCSQQLAGTTPSPNVPPGTARAS